MNHLLRSLAPFGDAVWELIDDEARERLVPALGARQLVDFSGPHGWEHSATPLGRVEDVATDQEGLVAQRRRSLAVVELRAPFTLSRAELAAGDRGAADVHFDNLDAAAVNLASRENSAVLHGWGDAGMPGIGETSAEQTVHPPDEIASYPSAIAQAVERLLRNGVGGPYALALSSRDYTRVVETAEHGGYPLVEHLREILGGPMVWTPGIDGGVVLTLRGGDFLFESGQDISVGYDSHDGEEVALYLEESFTFRSVTPEAAVVVAPLARLS
jgi:uncharacterized linocin/CFP29 family protein